MRGERVKSIATVRKLSTTFWCVLLLCRVAILLQWRSQGLELGYEQEV